MLYLLLPYPPTGITLGSLLGMRANWGKLNVLVGCMEEASVRSASNPVFLLFAMALRIGPRRRVATASRTGPRSTCSPAGGLWGLRALEMPPTTAPSSPPAMASDAPDESSSDVFSDMSSSAELSEPGTD